MKTEQSNGGRAARSARRRIARFIKRTKTIAANLIFAAVSLLTAAELLLSGIFFYGRVLENASSDPAPRVVFILLGVFAAAFSYFFFKPLITYVRTLKNSLDGLEKRGLLESAAAELGSENVTVFGRDFKSGRFRTVQTENFLFSKGLASAVSYDDILMYYYQPLKALNGTASGYLIAYGTDTKHPFSFFLGTKEPENAAKQIMQDIAERNPSAIYGAENKDKYLAMLGQSSENK